MHEKCELLAAGRTLLADERPDSRKTTNFFPFAPFQNIHILLHTEQAAGRPNSQQAKAHSSTDDHNVVKLAGVVPCGTQKADASGEFS